MTTTGGVLQAQPRDLRLEAIVRHLSVMDDQSRASALLRFHPESERLERQRDSAAPGRTLNDLLWEELSIREELAVGTALVSRPEADDPLAAAAFMGRRRSLQMLERFLDASRLMSRPLCLLGVLDPPDADRVVDLAGLWATTAAVSGVNDRQRETILGAIDSTSARKVVDCGLQSDDWQAGKPLSDIVRLMLSKAPPDADAVSMVGSWLIGARLDAWDRKTVRAWVQLSPACLGQRLWPNLKPVEGASAAALQDIDGLLERALRHLGHWGGA